MRYRFNDFTLDTERYELWRAGTLVNMQPKGFDVLTYLVEHRDRVVSKQELLEECWPGQFISDATLSSCIRVVRRAVSDSGQAQRVIQTRHRRGFRFVAALDEVDDETHAPAQPFHPVLSSPGAPPGRSLAEGPLQGSEDQRESAPECLTVERVETEHKVVTVLCAGLVDATIPALTRGPEAIHHLMQAYVATAQEVISAYGGTLTHITADGFMALFGVPLAQQDHARRAVLAAVALRQALQERPADGTPAIQLGIGVHTGSVIVSNLKAENHWLYTPVGETIALALRLRQRVASGVIRLSAATYQLVQADVHVDDEDKIGLGVDTDAGPVYRVRGIAPRRSGMQGRGGRTVSRFAGRGRELALLHERLRHATQGQGQVVGIAGEPGMGKTRLLAEFRQSLAQGPVSYVEGHCLAYGATTPYRPVQDLLRQLCGIVDTDDAAAITTKVHAALESLGLLPAAEAPYLLALLDTVTNPELLARLSRQEIRARTFASLHQFCLATSRRQALVLVVENLHWSDPTSEEWLSALVERFVGAAILVLATYRSGYRPAWLAQSLATQLALPRLTAEDSLALVQSVPYGARLSETMQQAIVAKAAGNPFFLEELARAVGEPRSVSTTRHIPDTIQAVLAARIDRLPSAAKHLLQAAAVLGSEVSIPLLEAIAGVPADTLVTCLQHLQAAEFLYESRLSPEAVYTFTHVLTQDVAYGSLLHARRLALHAQIVDAIERLYAERLREHVEPLALHAFQGERWEKAVTYGRQAGEKALARSAYREAAAFFEQGLEALEHLAESRHTTEQAVDLRLALRTALYPSGDWERILAVLREAEPLAVSLNDPRRLAQVSVFLSRYFHSKSRYDEAIAAGRRALDLATTAGDVSLQGLANQYLGQAYMTQSAFRRAIDHLGRALRSIAREPHLHRFGTVTQPAVFSRFLLARCHAYLGTFTQGRTIAQEGLRIAEIAADPASLLFALRGIGVLNLRQGDLPRALPQLERAMAICQRSDLWALFPQTTADLGDAYILSGRAIDAVPLLAQAIEQSTVSKDGRAESTCRRSMGEAQLLFGCLKEARAFAERALALSQEMQERGMQAYILHLLGDIAARREPAQPDRAETAYRQALALAEELGMRPLQAHCHLGLGRLYARTGLLEQARRELCTAMALYQAMAMTFWLPQAEAALSHRGA